MKRFIKFVVTALIVAVICIILAKIPKIFVDVYKYCVSDDKGYMWVINIAIAAFLTILVRHFVKSKFSTILSIAVFIFAIPVTELLIWHRDYILGLISIKIPAKVIASFAVGLFSGVAAYLIEMNRERKNEN